MGGCTQATSCLTQSDYNEGRQGQLSYFYVIKIALGHQLDQLVQAGLQERTFWPGKRRVKEDKKLGIPNKVFLGEQGWCSGESARLPPMCPGFDSRTRRHMWAEFVGSLFCSERFFSGNSGFPLSSKTNI